MKKKITGPTKKALYFKSEHCSQCHYFSLLVASKCKAKGVAYEEIDAEKDAEMVSKYGVRNVPYVVFMDGDNVLAQGHAAEVVKEI